MSYGIVKMTNQSGKTLMEQAQATGQEHIQRLLTRLESASRPGSPKGEVFASPTGREQAGAESGFSPVSDDSSNIRLERSQIKVQVDALPSLHPPLLFPHPLTSPLTLWHRS